MKKYSLIIFDFDGTLVDTAPDIALHANSVLRTYGFPKRNLGQVKKGIGGGVHELLKSLAPAFTKNPARLDEAVLLFKQRYAQAPAAKSKLYPYVERMLKKDLKGIRKTIVTNKPHELTLAILKKISIARCFEQVIGMGQSFPAKPDPSAIQHVIKKFKASKANTLFIGDSQIDEAAAANAGIDFWWMSYGYDTRKPKKAARRLFSARQWKDLELPKISPKGPSPKK